MLRRHGPGGLRAVLHLRREGDGLAEDEDGRRGRSRGGQVQGRERPQVFHMSQRNEMRVVRRVHLPGGGIGPLRLRRRNLVDLRLLRRRRSGVQHLLLDRPGRDGIVHLRGLPLPHSAQLHQDRHHPPRRGVRLRYFLRLHHPLHLRRRFDHDHGRDEWRSPRRRSGLLREVPIRDGMSGGRSVAHASDGSADQRLSGGEQPAGVGGHCAAGTAAELRGEAGRRGRAVRILHQRRRRNGGRHGDPGREAVVVDSGPDRPFPLPPFHQVAPDPNLPRSPHRRLRDRAAHGQRGGVPHEEGSAGPPVLGPSVPGDDARRGKIEGRIEGLVEGAPGVEKGGSSGGSAEVGEGERRRWGWWQWGYGHIPCCGCHRRRRRRGRHRSCPGRGDVEKVVLSVSISVGGRDAHRTGSILGIETV
mmetsp:Transcript_39867/g.119982  ORF Transcript_39867/g.119982 Transcript_39867/m.119982 type:complete len:416 (-) Transcript_39867:136-1383(-)